MNVAMLMGRLTRDPDVRYSQTDPSMAIARYTLAVDRPKRKDQNSDAPTADFISCIAFGKSAEFAEKYLKKGIKIAIRGHIQTGNYTKDDGTKVYTTDVVIDQQEFAESKTSGNSARNAADDAAAQQYAPREQTQAVDENGAPIDGFMNIPDGIDENLPFN